MISYNPLHIFCLYILRDQRTPAKKLLKKTTGVYEREVTTVPMTPIAPTAAQTIVQLLKHSSASRTMASRDMSHLTRYG